MSDATTTAPVSGTKTVIAASALGTVFEWYDFYIYGTLATIIGAHFFPAGNDTVSLLITLATFGVGFGMRPLGAMLFGVLGDRLGRKYTFLATVTLMGGATAAIGVLPTYAEWGIAAPTCLVALRVLQGLALGGEYGGATIYVAEHAPQHRRGFFTGFIQAAAVGGFLLSLAVVLIASHFVPREAWQDWGWRVPFLFSLVLLAVSLWMRLRLHESPVFRRLQREGAVARNPLLESFNSWGKVRLILVALLTVCAVFTTIFYTAFFQALFFVQNALRIEDNAARLIVGGGALAAMGSFVLFGHLSDRWGRKPVVLGGYALTLVLLFPLFHMMMNAGNPELATAIKRAPVVVIGNECRFDPFAVGGQTSPCGKLLDALSTRGVPYTKTRGNRGAEPEVTVAGRLVATDPAALDAALAKAGYRLEKQVPPPGRALVVALAVLALGLLSGMTYGPVAALLVELFPARVRYTSLSVPYHIGSGYFGGFLPFITQFIVAKTGDPFAGLWYTFAVVAVGLVIALFALPETAGRALEEGDGAPPPL
jgi:MFS family permease